MSKALACLFCFYILFRSTLQQCLDPKPDEDISILETDKPGTTLFYMDHSEYAVNWTMTVKVQDDEALARALRNYFVMLKRKLGDKEMWVLQIYKVLDAEKIYKEMKLVIGVIHVVLQCIDTKTGNTVSHLRSVWIRHVSEFSPQFHINLTFHVKENTNIGIQLIDLKQYIADEDIPNILQETDINRCIENVYTGQESPASEFFKVTTDCIIELHKPIDYEMGITDLYLNVTVIDSGFLTATTLVKLILDNVNDGPPRFVCEALCSSCLASQYSAFVEPTHVGLVYNIMPNAISAADTDNGVITYTFLSGQPPNSLEYITLNSSSGEVSIKEPLEELQTSLVILKIQAKEEKITAQFRQRALSNATLALIILDQPRVPSLNTVETPEDRNARAHLWCLVTALIVCAMVVALFVMKSAADDTESRLKTMWKRVTNG